MSWTNVVKPNSHDEAQHLYLPMPCLQDQGQLVQSFCRDSVDPDLIDSPSLYTNKLFFRDFCLTNLHKNITRNYGTLRTLFFPLLGTVHSMNTFSSNPRNSIIFKANSEEYMQHQLKILCHNLISENLQITTNSAPILSKCTRWNLHKSACWPQFLST